MSEAALERPLEAAESLAPAESAAAPPRDDGPAAGSIGSTAGRRRNVDPVAAARALPRGDLSAFQRAIRYRFSRMLAILLMRGWFRIEVVGAERFLPGPAMYCFNHLSWMDPILMLATFPRHPRLYFYGPKEADLSRGGRNRFMWWTGLCVPFSPRKDDLITSVRWTQAVFDTGGSLAISGEGAIHVHEGDLLPFQEGVAYLAMRGGVPIVPVAITGVSWARFRGRVLVRVGEAIPTGERPTRQAIADSTARVWHALRAMVAGDRDQPPPSSRIERWLTDLFNDWGPGGREAAARRRGPDPSEVPSPDAPAPAPSRGMANG